MSDISANNKRIAKNTLFLYVRMFVSLILGLYTSRIVIDALGVSDYGIYNLVGGFITVLAFLNTGMAQSSQRYLSYELGKGDSKRLNDVFCMSVNTHAVITLIIILLSETIGVWFVNYQLNIPDDRMLAANVVFQCSIFTFAMNIMSVPYNASIIAHEKMSIYAYMGILDVVLKLLTVYVLLIIPFDKLVIYSVLIALVAFILRLCYWVYCKRNFEECTYYIGNFDKNLFKEMFSFAGWSVVGNLGFSLKDQMANVILNWFCGTTLNAARGVGLHVGNLVTAFSGNITAAINPQITKQYAMGNIGESQKLVYAGSKYAFYLLTLVSIPVIINIDYLLGLWLKTVPKYTSEFLVLSLIVALFYALANTVTVAIQATGNMKIFQLGICVLMLLEVPAVYIILEMGCPPYVIMYPSLVTGLVAVLFRFFLIKKYVPTYSYKYYLLHVLFRCFGIFIVSYYSCVLVRSLFDVNLFGLFVSALISVLLILLIIYLFGISKREREFVKSRILSKIAFVKHLHKG